MLAFAFKMAPLFFVGCAARTILLTGAHSAPYKNVPT